ncbi:MAG: PAS domain S-box protein, partial [Terriglobia bacterium]
MTTPWNVRGSAILLAQQELARLAPSLLGKTLLVVGMSQLGVMVLCARWLVSQSWGSLLVGGFLSTLVIAGALYWLAYRPAAQVAAQAAGLPAEAYFQAVVEAVNDAVVVTEGDGSIVFVNPAARLLFGYEPQKLLGQPISSLLPLRASEPEGPAGRPPLLRALQPAAIEGCRQDGSRFPVEVSSRSASAGEREFTVTVIRDSSERRRTERELARLAAFPQLNPTPVLECDRQGRITYANPAAEGLLRSLWVSDPAAQLLPRGLPELVRRGSQENVPVLNQESTVGAQTFLWSLYPLPELNRIHVHATDI